MHHSNHLVPFSHPLGCTSVAQIAEIASQITGFINNRYLQKLEWCTTCLLHVPHLRFWYCDLEESILKGVFTIPWCPLCDKATWPPSESCTMSCMAKPLQSFGRIISTMFAVTIFDCRYLKNHTCVYMCRILGDDHQSVGKNRFS